MWRVVKPSCNLAKSIALYWQGSHPSYNTPYVMRGLSLFNDRDRKITFDSTETGICTVLSDSSEFTDQVKENCQTRSNSGLAKLKKGLRIGQSPSEFITRINWFMDHPLFNRNHVRLHGWSEKVSSAKKKNRKGEREK